jgi:hypothetical protein
MSAPSVDFDREYRFRDGITRLDADQLNSRFLSIHQRLNAVEQLAFNFQALAAEIGQLGLARLNALLLPLITEAQTQLVAIQAATAEAVALLEDLEQRGILAESVPVSPIPGLTGTNVQAALAGLVTTISTLNTTLSAAISAETAARSSAVEAEAVQRQAAVSALSRQIRMLALTIAELRGDRMGMADGIVDPYTDASDLASVPSVAGGFIRSLVVAGASIATPAQAIASGEASGTNPATAAFDGSTSTSWNSPNGAISGSAWIGQIFASARLLARVEIVNSASSSGDRPTQVAVQYSDNGSSWTPAVAGAPLNQSASGVSTITIPETAGPHRWWRVLATSNAPNNFWQVIEARFFEGLLQGYTARSVSFASDVVNPSLARLALHLLPPETGGAVAVNSDLVSSVSRDGGVSWTAVTLEPVETLMDGSVVYDGSASISGQPAGSSMVYRHVAASGKDARIAGTVFQWGA